MESFWVNATGATLRQSDYLFNCPVTAMSERPMILASNGFL